jgi:hypothetical protein
MPKYYREYATGYDLTEELSFIEINGERCQTGSAGSIILCCPACARESMRINPTIRADWVSTENCYCGAMREAVRLSELDTRWRPLCEANGYKLTTVDERRARRISEEKERPWDWVFGSHTEADYPDGFVKEAARA